MGLKLDDWQKKVLEAKGNIVLASGRQIGKSTCIAMRDGKFAAENPKKSVLIISFTERQAQELFIKVLFYLEDNYPHLISKGKERPTKHVIKLKNGSIIRCLPTGLAGGGIRGFTIDRLTCDEAAFIPDEVFQAVTPMLLTTGGDIVLLSTPHGKKGYFYEAYKNEHKHFEVFHINSEEVINNREVCNSWSLAQKEWALKFLDDEKKRMTALQYAQEYMGMFIEELRQFFSDALIQKCMKLKRPEKIIPHDYWLGVDVARMGDDECTFEIIDRTDRNNLIHVENIILKKIYLNEVSDKILFLDKLYNFREIYIDDGGIGVGVFDYLLAHEQTKRKVIAINNRSRPLDRDEKFKKKMLKEDLYSNLLGLMERGEISLLDDDEIYLSLKSIQYEYITKASAMTKVHIFGNYSHIAEGLIRAAWCARDKRLNIWVR